MNLKEALENESQRTAEIAGRVFLHVDGNFFHAYNWSAWLIKNFICTEDYQKSRGDENMLNVKHYKKKNDYCLVGFPLDSASKYIPNYQLIQHSDERCLYVDINLDEDFDTLLSLYGEWKDSIPVSETKKSVREITRGNGNASMLGRSGLFGIVSKILSYPVENSTPAENIAFISSIKQDIAGLL